MIPLLDANKPCVGIVVLNYHHPAETLDCVRRLLENEPSTTRVLWVENDAHVTEELTLALIRESGIPFQLVSESSSALPPSGTLGVLLNAENLGYAEGNNAGLRLLDRLDTPYAWVLNNDTLLMKGNSDLLVQAAKARPEVGLWGTTIQAERKKPFPHMVHYMGGRVRFLDFSLTLVEHPDELEQDPHAYVSGCSLFGSTKVISGLGFIPKDYFLYYEDPAFTLEARKRGYQISGVREVEIYHTESLSTGRRSPLMEFYNRRNRWFFIQRFFPHSLAKQQLRIFYTLQKLVFRGQFFRLRIELVAFRDFKQKRWGRSHRAFSRTLAE
ncbi:MAG: glycosyltransferase family 2 protein [Rectinemataceae bacterium]|nr:glycosyltransferase family 2 protein [Rectinemataceae bacterium]